MQQHIMRLIISHQQQPMDPPDSYDEATQSAPYKPGPGPSNKRARETAACEADFITIGREIQNRYQLKLGTGMSESIKFRSYFGCGEEVAVILWTMLDAYSLLPDGAQILHLLWALFFMKVYPTESIWVCGSWWQRTCNWTQDFLQCNLANDPCHFWLGDLCCE